MRYYVYALIDPTSGNRPFYIGKGLDNRLQAHFKNSNLEIVGCDTEGLLADASAESDDRKTQRIQQLSRRGFDHSAIARVIGRRMDESTAFTIESYLIRSVYGLDSLTNRVHGAHSDRFRKAGDWSYLNGFDICESDDASQLSRIESRFGRYYVYVLRDPETSQVFYVGKGTGRRVLAHFEQAEFAPDFGRLARISALKAKGFRSNDIGRVVARVESEQAAFSLEALLVKFVHGQMTLENIQPGHHADMFRAFGDWERRLGFDLPWVIEPGVMHSRRVKRDGMIGEGLAVPLMAVAASFPSLEFDPPQVLNSGELGIEADAFGTGGATRIKLFIRRKKLQVELRPKLKAHRDWMRNHFTKLGAQHLLRSDDVFIPGQWKGAGNMTDDLTIMTERVRLLLEIVSATCRGNLSQKAESLLPIPSR